MFISWVWVRFLLPICMGEKEMKEEGECFKEKNVRGVGREKLSWVVVTEVLLLL